jgi:peptide/nickel transport system permease protein
MVKVSAIDTSGQTSSPRRWPTMVGAFVRWIDLRWMFVGLILGAVVVIVAAGPLIAPYSPDAIDAFHILAVPSGRHLHGTDDLGRDVLSRLILATRTDMGVALAATILPFLIGSALGAVAGYLGGWIDRIIMSLCDLLTAFPVYILALALVTVLGAGDASIVIAYTAIGWVAYARLLRVKMAGLRSKEYVDAARLGGLGHWRLAVRHMLPNAAAESIALLASQISVVVLSVAAFSYLGVGVTPPTPEWGSMIAEAQPYLLDNWWMPLAPGVCIALVGMAFILLGELIEERFVGADS